MSHWLFLFNVCSSAIGKLCGKHTQHDKVLITQCLYVDEKTSQEHYKWL